MHFLIDVHLSIGLSKFLGKQPSCRSTHINLILQKWNTTDNEICKYADENDLVVVTKDSDFTNSHLINNTPKKLIRIVLGNISNNDLMIMFSDYLPAILSLSAKKQFYVEIGSEQISVID